MPVANSPGDTFQFRTILQCTSHKLFYLNSKIKLQVKLSISFENLSFIFRPPGIV